MCTGALGECQRPGYDRFNRFEFYSLGCHSLTKTRASDLEPISESGHREMRRKSDDSDRGRVAAYIFRTQGIEERRR